MPLYLAYQRLKVPKTNRKTEIKVKVNIKPVRLAEVTPAICRLYRRFWAKLITQARDEVKGER